MNKKVYFFLRRYFLDGDSPIMYSKLLEEDDIKEFISKRYGIIVDSVERVECQKKNVIAFRFSGIYLHHGFNNISFEGSFLANDFSYEIKTSINLLYATCDEDWKNFMTKKFGRKYVRRVKIRFQ